MSRIVQLALKTTQLRGVSEQGRRFRRGDSAIGSQLDLYIRKVIESCSFGARNTATIASCENGGNTYLLALSHNLSAFHLRLGF